MKSYVALFEMDNGCVGVIFPDLPGLISTGENFQEAQRNAYEALALYADGEKNLPEPRTLEQIKQEWPDWENLEKNYNFIVGIVDLLPIKQKSKRINITLSTDLLAKIDCVTDNRSGFIDSALRTFLKI